MFGRVLSWSSLFVLALAWPGFALAEAGAAPDAAYLHDAGEPVDAGDVGFDGGVVVPAIDSGAPVGSEPIDVVTPPPSSSDCSVAPASRHSGLGVAFAGVLLGLALALRRRRRRT